MKNQHGLKQPCLAGEKGLPQPQLRLGCRHSIPFRLKPRKAPVPATNGEVLPRMEEAKGAEERLPCTVPWTYGFYGGKDVRHQGRKEELKNLSERVGVFRVIVTIVVLKGYLLVVLLSR